MKVLKKGKPQVGWAKEYLCSGSGNGDGGCGALLLVEQDDVFLTIGNGGRNDKYFTFRCPDCGVWTDLPKSEVTFTVRPKVSERDGVRSGEKLMER